MNWSKTMPGRGGPERAFAPTEPSGSTGGSAFPAGPAPSRATDSVALSEPGLMIAAVGDLHGRSDLLERLTRFIDRLVGAARGQLIEVYLGDYVDRGGDSRGVIEALIARRQVESRRIVCLAGNHEAMLLGALHSDEDFLKWLGYGGQTTLKSYGVAPPRVAREVSAARAAFAAALPETHLDFLRSLDLSYRHENFFFAHAGVRPGVALERQSERDLLWIREGFMTATQPFGAVVVHGHTPVPRPVLRPNRISIDTGAYQTGILTCAMISARGVRFLDTRSGEIAPTP